MTERKELDAEIRGLMEKATRSLKAAQGHIKEGDHDFASARSYYAVFYAMPAILLVKRLTFSKHAGVIAAFGENFIRPGVFPRDFGAMIARLFRERQVGDYDAGISVSSDSARDDVRDASSIVNAIRAYLVQSGHLS